MSGVFHSLRRLAILPASVLALSGIGCAPNTAIPQKAVTQAPPAIAAVTDGREVAMREALERNKIRPPLTSAELRDLMSDPVHKPYLQLWRQSHSYYALLEISEGIRRKEIQELLGTGSPNYPNSEGHLLEYGGDRNVPYASHILIHFDEHDVVDHVDWVSE
jgi:hypothetical protein